MIREVVSCKNSETESLYEYFHRHTFYNANGERLKLLIIFDQFEEIFTLQDNVQKKKSFFAHLADLLNDIMPDELQQKIELSSDDIQEEILVGEENDFGNVFKDLNLSIYNNLPEYVRDNEIHFVFTIREDFLSEFEYYSAAIPSLKQNRYGLRPINEEQAAQIILRPVPGLIDESVAKLIIEKITGKKDFKIDGVPEIEVDSAVLSLYLNRLYEAKEGSTITRDLVEQKGGEIISDFYNDALLEISDSAIEYLEEMLLNGQGRRDNITIYDAINDGNISEYELDVLCNRKKILRQFNYAGDLRIEYVHDILCPVVNKNREERCLLRSQEEQKRRLLLEEEQKRKTIEQEKMRLKQEAIFIRSKNRKRIFYLVSLLFFVVLMTSVLVYNNKELKNSNQMLDELNQELILQQNKILRSQRKLLSVKIKQLLDDGDSYTAKRLSLNAMSIGGKSKEIVDSLSSFSGILRYMYSNDKAVFRGHTSAVVDVAYSPNNSAIASVSDTTVMIWDPCNGRLRKTLQGSDGDISSIAFSPDGNKLVIASANNLIHVYDVNSGLECYSPLKKHQKGVRYVMFSPNGKRIVSASKDRSVCFWDADNGSFLKQYKDIHDNEILCLAISNDNSKIATASADKKIKIWKADNDSLCCVLSGHTDWIRSVDFNPLNNNQLISASDDGTIRVWNLNNFTDTILHKANSYVTKAIYSPTGDRIVASYRDGTIKVWDVETETEIIQLQGSHNSYVNSVAISSDGKKFVSAGSDMLVRLWDLKSNLIRTEIAHEDRVLSLATDGDNVIAMDDDNKVSCYNLHEKNNNPIWTKVFENRKWQNAVINSKKNIAAFVGYGSILLRDMSTGEFLNIKNNAHRGWIYSVDVSPDGEYLVSAGADGNICIWDWELNIKNKWDNCHDGIITSVKYSHKGSHVVSASADGTIKIWNVFKDFKDSEPIEFRGHIGSVLYATFSNDDKSILSCSSDRTAKIWSIDTKQNITFSGHGGSVNKAIYGINENEIITVSSDNLIRIWDVKTQKELLTLYGHRGSVSSIVLDEKCSNILTSSWDNTIRVWNYPSLKDIIEDVFRRFGDNPLTDDELRELDVL